MNDDERTLRRMANAIRGTSQERAARWGIAEIERLQSCLYAQEAVKPLYDEIERLRALSQNNAHSWDTLVKERDRLRAEIEQLLGRK